MRLRRMSGITRANVSSACAGRHLLLREFLFDALAVVADVGVGDDIAIDFGDNLLPHHDFSGVQKERRGQAQDQGDIQRSHGTIIAGVGVLANHDR
ncbi:MAG: hypothetical protein WDO18_20865 [Acidobacteriota bacterium]